MTTLLLAKHDNRIAERCNQQGSDRRQGSGRTGSCPCRRHGMPAASPRLRLSSTAWRKCFLRTIRLTSIVSRSRWRRSLSRSAGPYDAIVAPGTTTGKNVMPRVAALLDVMQVSDIIKVVGPDTFERPIYAGNAIQTVQATDAKKVITVRTAAFQAARPRAAAAPIEAVTAAADPDLSMFEGEELSKSDRPDLRRAKIVISGGRALARPRISRRSSSRSPTSSARRSAPRARRWTPATRPTTGRSARPARWWRPISTSRSASRARSSISPA